MANVQKYLEQFHQKIRTDYEMSETLRDKRDIIINRIRKHLAEKLPNEDRRRSHC